MKRIFSIVLLLLVTGFSYAQNENVEDQPANLGDDSKLELFETPAPKKEKRKSNAVQGIAYENQFSAGGKLTTTGWSLFAEYSMQRSFSRQRLFQFEFMEIKHPKQRKQTNEFSLSPFGFDSPKSFVFGKKNNFYALHFGYGSKFLIGQKAEKSGVEINLSFAGGPSLGLVKPYYLNIINDGDSPFLIEAERFDPDNPDHFLEPNSIYGSSGFSYGLDKISLIPGAYGKIGFNFDWATEDQFVKQIETGLGADIYISDIPLMIIENNKPYTVYLYLSLQLGNKW